MLTCVKDNVVKARVYSSPTEFEDIEIPERLLKNYRKKKMLLTTSVLVAPGSDGVALIFGEGRKALEAEYRQFVAPLKLFDGYVTPGTRPAKEILDEMAPALIRNLQAGGMVFRQVPGEPDHLKGTKSN